MSRSKVYFQTISLCLFLSLTSSFIQGCGKKSEEDVTHSKELQKGAKEGRPGYSDPAVIAPLYQMIKDTHHLFEKHKITYWAEGGTLIGAVRHKGIIPWDDDADLCLEDGHEKILFSPTVQDDFKKYGYEIKDHGNDTYRIVRIDNPFPFVDLFRMTKKGGKYYYTLEAWGKRNGEPMYISENEVMPIKKAEFGDFEINIPGKSKEFLIDYFGKDVMEIGYWTHTHHHPKFEKVWFKLTDEDRKPAQPSDKTEDRVNRPVYTDKAIIAPLYQMIKDTHEIFEKHDITYWAEGGSLIGAVRHKGIIPWDDDADFCLEDGDEQKVFSDPVKAEFKTAGYQVNDHGNNTYRIVRIGNPFPFVDLFRMTKQNGKYYYTLAVWGQRKGENMYISEDEVMPIKKAQFGSFEINIPGKSMEFLYDYFGKDVMNIGYWSHVHHNVEGFWKMKFNLTDEDRKPAQPIGPLENRIR